MQFKSVGIMYFLHATEDYDRVIISIAKELSVSIDKFEISSAEGHYGNPLRIVKAHIIGAEAKDFAENLFGRLSLIVKDRITQEIGRSLNEHGDLFVRLDKQQILAGKIVLAEVDPIRIKFKLRYNMPREQLLQAYVEFLQG
jgi:RNA binding exosome subunit